MFVPLNTGLAAVLELSPVAGFQLYVVPPPAFMVVVVPLHIVPDTGVAVMVGMAFTVTVTVAVELHPVVVPVTV